MPQRDFDSEIEDRKELYSYQQGDIATIFERLDNAVQNYHLLYQLPTGGGKTVIFSEIVRRYISKHDKKVLVLTHRIELCKQTSKMLKGFDVKNKIINSKVKELPDQNDFSCFVAMVETLKNRINDKKLHLDNIGLVIIDEAHYNSFRKLLSSFKNAFIFQGFRGSGLFKKLIDFRIEATKDKKIIEATCTKMSLNEYLKRGFKIVQEYKLYTKVRHENL
jgi:superfamily II DNA or RNA helicase